MESERVRARCDERNRVSLRLAAVLWSLCIVSAVVIAAPARQALSFDGAVTRSPEDRALAMDRPVSSLVFSPGPAGEEGARWRLEAGEWRLFGIQGLAVVCCTAEVRCAGWGGIGTASILSSPVGKESAFGATLMAAEMGRVGVAGGLRFETVSLDGFERQSILTFCADAVVRFSDRVAVCPGVGGVRLAGVRRPGASASLRVVAFPAGALSGVAAVAVTRSGRVVCEVSSRIRVSRRVQAVLGYNDAAASIQGSLSIAVRTFALDVGASVHPVLGVSEAIFLSWRWGGWEI